jgi:hypothetical protein
MTSHRRKQNPDRPRYYVVRQHPGCQAWGYWQPCLRRSDHPTRMAELGFGIVRCGPDGPEAWKVAEEFNAKWDAARMSISRAAEVVHKIDIGSAPGTLAEGFDLFRMTGSWNAKARRTREDWFRGWRHFSTEFADQAPSAVSFQRIDAWYWALLERAGVREARRAVKIWRALWQVLSAMRTLTGEIYCRRDEDPSRLIRARTPAPRKALWTVREIERLVERARIEGYPGLAALLQVAWDTMFSPVDLRRLTLAQLAQDNAGALFSVARAKTGKAAIGTVGPRALELIEALPYERLPAFPLFRTRTGRTYQPGMLDDDFATIRALEFPGDRRTIADFRRSGAVEAVAGGVDPAALAGKMANSIDKSRELQATYTPHTAQLVRLADASRGRGRKILAGK